MKAKKTSITHLNAVPRCSWSGAQSLDTRERGLYTNEQSGERFEFVVVPKSETGSLIAFFSGDARRSKFQPPVFQRWSWASKFPATCVYFSDPALYKDEDLGLAWYAGNPGGDYLEQISHIVSDIARSLGVRPGSVFSYGSSGGGFAALRLARYFPGLNVIAANPQTDLWKYPEKWTRRLTRACYGQPSLEDVEPEEHYKFSAHDPLVLDHAAHIFLAQNEQDTDHYENHFSPFVSFAQTQGGSGKLTKRIFSDPSGHAGAEDRETFDAIQKFITAQTDNSQVGGN